MTGRSRASRSTRRGRSQTAGSNPETAGSSGTRTRWPWRRAASRRTPQGQGVQVDINVQVTGFDVRPDGGAFRMELRGGPGDHRPGRRADRGPVASRSAHAGEGNRASHRQLRRLHHHPHVRQPPGRQLQGHDHHSGHGRAARSRATKYPSPSPDAAVVHTAPRAGGGAPREGRAAARRAVGRRARLHVRPRLSAELVSLCGLPGPRRQHALPRPRGPGARASRRRGQLRAHARVGRRAQHGIYSFRWLRSLCPCDDCGGEKR